VSAIWSDAPAIGAELDETVPEDGELQATGLDPGDRHLVDEAAGGVAVPLDWHPVDAHEPETDEKGADDDDELLRAEEHEFHEADADTPPVTSDEAPSVATRIWTSLRQGAWAVALPLLIATGVRDESRLTNVIFHARHAELGGRSIRPDEKALAREWLKIRDEVVRPFLRGPATTGGRPRVLSERALREAWKDYRGAKERMVEMALLGWNTPVNPETVDAWRALERALTSTGYEAHRAWVFKDRKISGSTATSLHAYGLAVDIDHRKPKCNVNRPTPDRRLVRFSPAPTKAERCADVQRRAADTSFTPEQVAAVEAIRTVDGHQVFTWGGRWNTTKDTMHFQINVTPAELGRGLAPPAGGQQLAEAETESPLTAVARGVAAVPRWLVDRFEQAFRDRASELRHRIVHQALAERTFWEGGGTQLMESDPAVLGRLRTYARATRVADPNRWATAFADDTEAWSSAFVCHVLESAGVRHEEFNFGIGHDEYIKHARDRRAARDLLAQFWLCAPHEVTPDLGDILCSNWGGSANVYSPGAPGGGLGADFRSHGDIVTGLSVNSRGEPVLVTTGGNIGGSVRRRYVPVDAAFRVTARSHVGVEPAPAGGTYFAVVRIRSTVNETYP
jgi:Uncharacterized protein conserved in bacteria (DUF2272)/D-alanyl-D-alanine carboxypeptidase